MIEMNYLVLPQPMQALEGEGYVTRLDAGLRGVRTIEAGPFGVVVTTFRGDQLIFTAAGYGTATHAPSLKPTAPTKLPTPSPPKPKPKKKPVKPARREPPNPVPPPAKKAPPPAPAAKPARPRPPQPAAPASSAPEASP